jgi:hypothetical protein
MIAGLSCSGDVELGAEVEPTWSKTWFCFSRSRKFAADTAKIVIPGKLFCGGVCKTVRGDRHREKEGVPAEQLNDAEDGGVGSDAEGHYEDGDKGEAWTFS